MPVDSSPSVVWRLYSDMHVLAEALRAIGVNWLDIGGPSVFDDDDDDRKAYMEWPNGAEAIDAAAFLGVVAACRAKDRLTELHVRIETEGARAYAAVNPWFPERAPGDFRIDGAKVAAGMQRRIDAAKAALAGGEVA
jgi:hypothetical protein